MSTYAKQKNEKAKATHRWQSVTATVEVCLDCGKLKRALLADNGIGSAHYTCEYVQPTPQGFIVTTLAGECPKGAKE